MRRQKMKMGTCSALRKIAFTVGKEETDQFQKQQDELAEHSCGAVSARYAVAAIGVVSVREGRFGGIASSHGPARRLPHLLRVKKTVGLHEMVVIWYELSSDQDEFLTELQLAHPARTRRLQ